MGQRCDVAQKTSEGSHGDPSKFATAAPSPSSADCVCRPATFQPCCADEQEATFHRVVERGVDAGYCGHCLEASQVPLVPVLAESEARYVENLEIPQSGIYTGEVLRGCQPHGFGTQSWKDGTVYTGRWHLGTAHGNGKLVTVDGSGYDGQWLEGRKHGAGTESLVGQSEYTGEFVDSMKHGAGTFCWEGGARYTGEFNEDALHGEGSFHWGDGRCYRGQWLRSRMHGRGLFSWPDGKTFEGKYLEDRKHGPGVFSWPDGSQCIGKWDSGKQTGLGTHVFADGTSRKGFWLDGQLDHWLEEATQDSAETASRKRAGAPSGQREVPSDEDVDSLHVSADKSAAQSWGDGMPIVDRGDGKPFVDSFLEAAV